MVCVRAAPCKGSGSGRDAGRIPAAQRRGQYHRRAGGIGAVVLLLEMAKWANTNLLRGNPQEVDVWAICIQVVYSSPLPAS